MALNRTMWNWVALTAFCGLLLLVSLVHKEDLGDDLRKLLEGRDKVVHGVAYAVLAVLACRALAGRGRVALRHVVAGVFFAVAYGALLEVMQSAFSDRTSSLWDAGANALGAGSGGLLWFAVALRNNGSGAREGDRRP